MASLYKWKKFNNSKQAHTEYVTEYYTDYEEKTTTEEKWYSEGGTGYPSESIARSQGEAALSTKTKKYGGVTLVAPKYSGDKWGYVISWCIDETNITRIPITKTRRVPKTTYTDVKGAFVGYVTADSTTAYPNNGKQGSYWYEYVGLANTAPTISGSNLDLGAKNRDFQVDYIIQDAEGDDVSVEIKVDGTIKQKASKTTLGVRKYFIIPIKDYKLGKHTIEITATDINGAKSNRLYTFQKVNSAPVISGEDKNLGYKNTAFTYTYQIHDDEKDSVKVIEKLNGIVIRTLTNATLDTDLSITISDETIKDLEINTENTIEIEVSDGTATSFRRVTFVRNNMPPIISDKDKDLGEVTNSLTYEFSATDPEKDKMTASIYLDDKIFKQRYAIEDGAKQSIDISGMDMLKIPAGIHNLKIVVEDDKGFSSKRVLTFTRIVKRLIMKLAGKGIETDELAKRILVSDAGIYVAKGAVVKYEVCNNSFDDKPTWEDATNMVKAGKAFNFQNKSKTNAKAGVDIKVTIERKDATMQSYISTIGGSFD